MWRSYASSKHIREVIEDTASQYELPSNKVFKIYNTLQIFSRRTLRKAFGMNKEC